jgi:hypothetical protein
MIYFIKIKSLSAVFWLTCIDEECLNCYSGFIESYYSYKPNNQGQKVCMHAQTSSVAYPHSFSVGSRVFYQKLKVFRAQADYKHPPNDQVQNVTFLTCLFTAFIVQDGHRGKCTKPLFLLYAICQE